MTSILNFNFCINIDFNLSCSLYQPFFLSSSPPDLSQPEEVEWRSLNESSLQVWWRPPPLPPNVTVYQYLITVLLRPAPRSPPSWNPAHGGCCHFLNDTLFHASITPPRTTYCYDSP